MRRGGYAALKQHWGEIVAEKPRHIGRINEEGKRGDSKHDLEPARTAIVYTLRVSTWLRKKPINALCTTVRRRGRRCTWPPTQSPSETTPIVAPHDNPITETENQRPPKPTPPPPGNSHGQLAFGGSSLPPMPPGVGAAQGGVIGVGWRDGN